MLSSQSSPLLRKVLLADAVISGVTGLLMLFGAGFLSGMLDLPEAFLRFAGLVLLPYVVFVAYVTFQQPISRTAAWVVIVFNDLWVAASIILLLGNWVKPNILGIAFVLIQALVVAGFSGIQFLAVRRSATTAA
jgi:hypothetical protein